MLITDSRIWGQHWTALYKSARVWLGEVLGLLSKWTDEKILRWEYVDLGEFYLRTVMDN